MPEGCNPRLFRFRALKENGAGSAVPTGVGGVLDLQLNAMTAIPVIGLQAPHDMQSAAARHETAAKVRVLGAPGDGLELAEEKRR